MRIFQAARRPTDWVRIALAALVLAFALDSIAHATHTHDSNAAAVAHHVACGYCATFGASLGATPVHVGPVVTELTLRLAPLPEFVVPVQQRFAGTAQARAPPGFLKLR
jgi:hypothetical protein